MRSLAGLGLGLGVAAVFCAAAPARAQAPRPERPYRGVFGGGAPSEADHSLTANLSLGGGYSTGLFFNERNPDAPAQAEREQRSGFGQLTGGLSYAMRGDRLTVNAGLGAGGRYYGQLEKPALAGYDATLSASYALTPRSTLSASQTASYAPLYSLDLFPQVFDPTPGSVLLHDQSFGTTRDARFLYGTTAGYTYELSRRTQLSLSYARRWSDGLDVVDRFVYDGGSGRITHALGRSLSAHVGYGFSRSVYGSGAGRDVQSHLIDVGIDGSHAISISRRTTLEFASNTMVLDDGTRTRAFIGGNVRLAREFGRTWTAGLHYERTAQFVETLRDPVLADSLAAMVSGMFGRRVQWQSSAGAAYGQVGLERTQADKVLGLFASSSATVGLSQHVALNVSYSFYHQRLDDPALSSTRTFTRANRHVIQAGLQLWAPLFERSLRSRSGNASR